MCNFNNNNKSACNSLSNPWTSPSKTSKNIDASGCNSSSNKWYSSLNPYKNIDEHGKKSYLKYDSVEIIDTRPPTSCHVSPIVQNIVIPNNNCFRERIPDNDRKNCRQNDSSYHQPQPTVQYSHHQYINARRVKQYSYKNDYDREKGVAHGMICSGIPTPEKQTTPIIP